MTHRTLIAAAALLIAAPALSQPPQGMVSASDPRSAAAGAEILRGGGSATDAAIAMALAQNVVEPHNSGIGGGGFLVWGSSAGKVESWNGREAAPAAADPRWFYGADGKPLPIREAVPGGRSVGVPGNLAMWAAAHKAHGRLPWKALFAPAIRLAQNGFAISPRLNTMIGNFSGHVDGWARTYLLDAAGKPKPVGTVLRNPEQAAFLAEIADGGPQRFYTQAAQGIADTVNRAAKNPSKMTAQDVRSYRARPFAPVCGSYRGYRICGMGPPSSGGVAVLQILRQLERFDMAALGKDSPVAWHLLAESQRLAYADRNMWMGDPAKVSVPVAGMLAPAYIAERSALIAPDRSMGAAKAGMPAGAPKRTPAPQKPEEGTTHVVAVDGRGDMASMTSTIESIFGSGLTYRGNFLNNELTDFDIVPTRDGFLVANRVEGGKRPRSSMSPLVVYDAAGKPRLAIGAAGGNTIIAQMAKALIAVLDWKLSAQEAIALPLIYAPGETGVVEKGTMLEAMVPALTALGDKVTVGQLGLKANAVEWIDGRLKGGADPRSEGVAVAQDGTVFDVPGRLGPPAVRD